MYRGRGILHGRLGFSISVSWLVACSGGMGCVGVLLLGLGKGAEAGFLG